MLPMRNPFLARCGSLPSSILSPLSTSCITKNAIGMACISSANDKKHHCMCDEVQQSVQANIQCMQTHDLPGADVQ